MQKALAATLQHMADQEAAARSRGREAGLAAARDAFYRGDIARAIVKYQKENGGILSAEDLANYRSGFDEPVADLVRRHQALCLRAVVPGAVAAAGDEPPRRRRAAQVRPQLDRLPAPHHRSGEARVRRPRGLFRRSAHRRRADRGDAVARLRKEAPRDDPPGQGLAGNAAGRRSAQARRRALRASGRTARAGARVLRARARHLARLLRRQARQRVRGDAERRLLQRAGDPGARHHSLAARQPELGRSQIIPPASRPASGRGSRRARRSRSSPAR